MGIRGGLLGVLNVVETGLASRIAYLTDRYDIYRPLRVPRVDYLVPFLPHPFALRRTITL